MGRAYAKSAFDWQLFCCYDEDRSVLYMGCVDEEGIFLYVISPEDAGHVFDDMDDLFEAEFDNEFEDEE